MTKNFTKIEVFNPAKNLSTDQYNQDVWLKNIYIYLIFKIYTSLYLDLLIFFTKCGARVNN